MTKGIEILKRSKAIEILSALLEGDDHIYSIISKVGGSATTVKSRIDELLNHGLISEKVSKNWPFKRTLRLTTKGREVAKYCKLVHNFLVDSIPEPREKYLLTLLYFLKEVKGSTRLGKLLFLMKHEFDFNGSFYRFRPHKYGPFSKDILNDADELKLLGLIEIREDPVIFEETEGEVIRKTYRLTPRGEEITKKLFDQLPSKTKKRMSMLRKFNRIALSNLKQYVYTKYYSNVFAYGSLMDQKFVSERIERIPEMLTAKLRHYKRIQPTNRKYPIAIKNPGSIIEGKLLLDILPEELNEIDKWEETPDNLYKRIKVRVETPDGNKEAFVYVARRGIE